MLPGWGGRDALKRAASDLCSRLLGRPHHHPARCKVCGRRDEEVGGISQTGLCPEHSEQALLENIAQMMLRTGPNWTKWRRSMVLCAHPELVDVLDGKP